MVRLRISESLILSLSCMVGFAACSSEETDTPASEPTIERPATADLPCNDAWGVVPATWTQLGHDDGQGNADLTSQSWSIGDIALSSANLVEATRFDIDRPARIVGASGSIWLIARSRTLATHPGSAPRLRAQRF